MKHTDWHEKADFPFEFRVDKWLSETIDTDATITRFKWNKRLDNVEEWLKDNIIEDDYIFVYHMDYLETISFRYKKDLLLFVMTWK